MERPSRERARLLARARRGDPDAAKGILAALADEPNAAWRASLISVLGEISAGPETHAALEKASGDSSALARAAAVNALAGSPRGAPILRRAISDPTRNVRLAGAWGLAMSRAQLPPEIRKEVGRMLENQSDQPSGALRQASLAIAEGREASARSWLKKAEAWDPSSGMFARAARLRYELDDLPAARDSYLRAIKEDPSNVDAVYSLALLEAETGDTRAARQNLRKAAALSPGFSRAWYNLGLAEAAENRLDEAAKALEKAAATAPSDPAPPYALATIQIRQGRIEDARKSLERALAADPSHAPSRGLLERLRR